MARDFLWCRGVAVLHAYVAATACGPGFYLGFRLPTVL